MAVFDISELSEQNPWWVDKENIRKDHKITSLKKNFFQWNPRIRYHMNLEKDAIYTLRGPRQVGKTTLIKIMIQDLLLEKDIKPENIFFWSAERNDAKELNQVLQTYLDWRLEEDSRKYIFIDEVCAVKEWPREIIHFANKGSFQNCTIVLTGSHSMDLKHATELMPGRRGGEDEGPIDYILLPMKFSEFVDLVWPEFKSKLFDLGMKKRADCQEKLFGLFKGEIHKDLETLMVYKKKLDWLFDQYLMTGGIPSVLNEYRRSEKISTRSFNIYLQAIIGDLNRYGYKEHYFKQIVREVFKVVSNPISWNSFTKNTEIGSHNTIQEYVTALEELYVASVAYRCSIHDGRIHSFMKKVYLLDPFFFHALHGWSNAKKDYFANAKANTLDLEMKSKMVESVVYNHLCRLAFGLNPRDMFDPKDFVCYYEDKKKKEVDFVLLFDENYYPFEVKYQASINSSDFFGFRAFKKGVLITKDDIGKHQDYVKIPVSIFLLLV